MSERHAPGPYEVLRYGSAASFSVVAEHGRTLALVNRERTERRHDGQISTHDGGMSEAEALATARLFKAAPELFAAADTEDALRNARGEAVTS